MKFVSPKNLIIKPKAVFNSASPQKKLALVCIAALSTLVLLYFLYLLFMQINPKSENNDELTLYLKQIEKSITLPQGEMPSLATVNDADKLKSEAGNKFFTNAKTGDKMIIYSTAKKVILYRPSEKKVIEYSSLSLAPATEQQQTETATDEKPHNYRIAILNSTKTAGLAKKYEAELKLKYPSVTITSLGNSQTENVQKTFIAPTLENNKTSAETIAKEMDIEISTLPETETPTPETDFVIILGEDKAH